VGFGGKGKGFWKLRPWKVFFADWRQPGFLKSFLKRIMVRDCNEDALSWKGNGKVSLEEEALVACPDCDTSCSGRAFADFRAELCFEPFCLRLVLRVF
jgi:hypothetical protein